jgi:type IV secretion system protein VirB9
VTGVAGDAELVNYRVQSRYMVVDRLFAAAELRLGDRRTEQRVRIVRDDGRRGGRDRQPRSVRRGSARRTVGPP